MKRALKNSMVLFLLSVVIYSCSSPEEYSYDTDGLTELRSENNRLRDELKRISYERNEEQRAIFEYIQFVDSVDSSLDRIYSTYLYYNSGSAEVGYDKKADLLERLNKLKSTIDSDRQRIIELEDRLKDLASNSREKYLAGLISTYRKKNAEQAKKIKSLSLLIEEMDHIIDRQEEEIRSQSGQIRYQDRVIQDKEQLIEKQRSELNKRYVLLIGRDKYIAVEMHKNEICIPQRPARINILNADPGSYDIEKINSQVSMLKISDSYWNNSKIMAVYVRGSF